jgi:hypothetical protein
VFLGEDEDETLESIGMDTPFYGVWGDLVASAALCRNYRDAGFGVLVEDIVDHPTMRQQIALLKGND